MLRFLATEICDDKFASADSGQILTYNSHKQLISTITIRRGYLGGYNIRYIVAILLPDDISELNQYMCGPLNRRDYLCGECRSRYGPAAFLISCTKLCGSLIAQNLTSPDITYGTIN